MQRRRPTVLSFACCLLLVATLAGAGEPVYKGHTASSVQLTDNSMPVRQFDPFTLALVATLDPALESSLRCTTQVQDGSQGRRGAKVILGGEVLDLDGNVVADLPPQRKRTNRDGNQVWEFALGTGFPTVRAPFLAVVDGEYRGTRRATRTETACDFRSRQPCQQDSTTACLLDDGRFQVQVDFDDGAAAGPGQLFNSSFGEALFFFPGTNADLLLRILDGCGDNNHYWVFYAATTNVEFELTVTDTEKGSSRVYDNPLGQPANAVTDTSAFATCP